MRFLKRCLLTLIVVVLLPAALLWVAGECTSRKSFTQTWRAFLDEFTSSRGFAMLSAALSVAVNYECFVNILCIGA